MLDPRIEDNAKKIKENKEAILHLATILDGIAWRTSTHEERAGLNILAEIRAILEKSQPRKRTIEC